MNNKFKLEEEKEKMHFKFEFMKLEMCDLKSWKMQAEESGKSDKRKKKYQKVSQNRSSYEESINGGLHGQSSSGCSSEDENTSEAKATSSAANVNGKTRASRGTATDPQSLYARVNI